MRLEHFKTEQFGEAHFSINGIIHRQYIYWMELNTKDKKGFRLPVKIDPEVKGYRFINHSYILPVIRSRFEEFQFVANLGYVRFNHNQFDPENLLPGRTANAYLATLENVRDAKPEESFLLPIKIEWTDYPEHLRLLQHRKQPNAKLEDTRIHSTFLDQLTPECWEAINTNEEGKSWNEIRKSILEGVLSLPFTDGRPLEIWPLTCMEMLNTESETVPVGMLKLFKLYQEGKI